MKKTFFVFGICLLGVISPVRAELPQKVRENFSDIVKDYCHSRVDYSLEEPIGEWDNGWTGQPQKFHKTVGCIFDSALEEVIKHEKEEAQRAFRSNLPIEIFIPEGDCQPKFLAIVQGEQEANGFVSECEKSEIAEISQIFSACRVAETVLQEWCAYDLFLYAKMQDEESFRDQGKDLGIVMGSRNLNFGAVQTKIQEERFRAEKAVMESLQWYQEAESASRQNAWLIALREELKTIQGDWAKIRSALGTFVDKFLNASIPPA